MRRREGEPELRAGEAGQGFARDPNGRALRLEHDRLRPGRDVMQFGALRLEAKL